LSRKTSIEVEWDFDDFQELKDSHLSHDSSGDNVSFISKRMMGSSGHAHGTGVNTDSLETDLLSQDKMEGIKRQLTKMQEIRESMYTYIQRNMLMDQEMSDWRNDLEEVKSSISDLEWVLESNVMALINWEDKVLDEDDIEKFESIYKRWN